MADPFSLMNRPLNRSARVSSGAGRQRKLRDPTNAADAEYLRRLHPDFDEVMLSADIDYRTRCKTDAGFASKFLIPPIVESSRAFREAHSDSVDAVCWGPEPGMFLTASHDSTLKAWRADTGKCITTLRGHTGGVYHCAVSGDKQLIASCGSGETGNALLWRWSQAAGPQQELKAHRRAVLHATFSGDSRLAATADQEGTLAVHDLGGAACTLQRTQHLGSVHGSSFCWEDPNLLCSAGADGFVQLLDLRENCRPPFWWHQPSAAANCVSLRVTLGIAGAHDGYPVYALEFVDRTTIFTVGADHKLKHWDLRMMAPWSPVCVDEYLGHTTPIRSLAVAPDQRFLVTGCEDGSCRIWQKGSRHLQEGQQKRDTFCSAVRTLSGHAGIVTSCAWQDAGNNVASILTSSRDQSVQLFSIGLQELA